VVYSQPNDQQSLSRARRVAVHHGDCDKLVMNQNLRTLLCFHRKGMPNCSKQKLLKVVSTEVTSMDIIKLEMFEGLTQLRYLDLSGNLSDKCGRGDKYLKGYMEKVIGTMKVIQTLNIDLSVRGNFVDGFSDCSWQIKTLRHVTTPCSKLPSSTKLPNLQTLKMVLTNESWVTELPHLPNLRTLRLSNKSCSWMVVAAFLGTLKHLISLDLRGSFPGDIFDMSNFPFYKHLQSLELCATNYRETPNEMTVDVIMLPPHLINLEIVFYHHYFQQDVMAVLENLNCLKRLELWGVKTNRKMRCSAKGFNQLEVLKLRDMTMLEDWEIEEGAMPILKELEISGCEELCVPQGLRHLINLQILFWVRNGHEGEYEVRNLCKHVPSLGFK
jgi:hypothetical protein